MFNFSIEKYKILTHIIFLSLFLIKFINVIQDRIDIFLYLTWIAPLLIFYYFINKLLVRSYQWFCFFLLIYFLFSSLRVFGTETYWLDILEFIFICFLFIHIMFGPKIIKNTN
jgi:uncharacterized membrane protein